VVLKRLKHALVERDNIKAIIKASAINNDGTDKSSFTAPGKKRIADVVRTVLKLSRAAPGDISYIETHGTATPLGDTIEIEALKEAFNINQKGYCGIGSIKSNIGHLDVAAGIASFIKTVLALMHQLIPASLHFETPNPTIDFVNNPFYINAALSSWEGNSPRKAGVCSFGIGGTNSFVLLEESPVPQGAEGSSHEILSQLILLSARTGPALEQMTRNLAEYLKMNPRVNLADVAYTLQVGKRAFAHRRMLVCSTSKEAVEALLSLAPGKVHTSVLKDRGKKRTAKAVEDLIKAVTTTADTLPGEQLKSRLEEIGMAWLNGSAIDWQELYTKDSLYSNQKPLRVPLPTYPFERQYYWINSVSTEELADRMEVLDIPGNKPAGTGIPGKVKATEEVLYQRPPLSTEYKAPRDEIEQTLARVWKKFFGIKEVGVNDDFFELGGDSLKAITVFTEIHKHLDTRIPITEIFRSSTIYGLAQYIRGTGIDQYSAIEPVEEKEFYPMSSVQKRIYILQQVETDSTGYNTPLIFDLEGKVHQERLDQVFTQLVARHESLRTSFQLVKGETVQRINHNPGLEVAHYDLAVPGDGPDIKKETQIIQDFIRPFDLSRSPLLRVGLIRKSEEKHVLMTDMHHIVSDGSSIGILVREFMMLYSGQSLPGLRIQYKDYTRWQNSEKQQEFIKRQETYWVKQFAGDIPLLNLPADYVRPPVQSFTGHTKIFKIKQEETEALKHIALKEDATLFMILFSLYNVLLAKICSQEDLVVGIPIAGRTHADLQHVIGMLVNTLALRNYPSGYKTFKEFLQEVKESTLSAFENQDYLFEDLVEKITLDVHRDVSRNPIFDTMFNLMNFQSQYEANLKIEIPGLSLVPREEERGMSIIDLSLQGIETEQGLWFKLEFCTKLFKHETIDRFIGFFKNIVSFIVKSPDQRISHIPMMSEADKNRVLYEFNDTETPYPRDKTIQVLFQEQVEKTPDQIAVMGVTNLKFEIRTSRSEGTRGLAPLPILKSITYKKLNEESNQLASLLIEKGVGPDTIVGFMAERSIEMIVGILGILRAGGAYLPLDPDYPEERIKYMLADSAAKILLTSDAINRVPTPHLLSSHASTLPSPHLRLSPAPATSLAYIIYTSGTTGKPKGVMTTHNNVIRVVRNTNYIEISKTDRVLQLSNYAFDGSVFDIYGALLNGALLLTMADDEVKSSDRLSGLIKQQQITVFFVTTALFNTLVDLEIDCLSDVRKVLFGGERVSTEHSRKALMFLGKQRIIHVYGPTETTVYATYYFIEEIPHSASTIPIGAPISNTIVYIVDKYRNLVPIGVSGEILIGGAGTARGYLNQPEFTAEKFCLRRPGGTLFEKTAPPGPPRKNFLLKGVDSEIYMSYMSHRSHIYRTGDLARWLQDGNIEFLGRIDSQVKIRGFRIETGEIERSLLDIDYIKEAVVVTKDDNTGGKYLCAYVVSGQKVASGQLRNILAKNLPDYMLPSYFMQIKQIPLTANGKIDRKALPEPQRDGEENYVPPGNKIQMKLVKIWSQILGIKKDIISIESNFFALGGHSLKATFLAAKIHKELQVKVPLAEIFKTPTIRGLSQYIQKTVLEKQTVIQPVEKKEYYTLSSPQRRLYVLRQMDMGNIAYNMPGIISLAERPDIEKLERTFIQLLKRHESLRTSFHIVEEKPVQRIHNEVEFKIDCFEDHETREKHEKELSEGTRGLAPLSKEPAASTLHPVTAFVSSFIRPFDLSQAPLLRICLLETPGEKSILMLDIHHIISDGISQKILGQDFIALYRGEILPLLRLQYKDFASWQTGESQRKAAKQQEAFWLNNFAGEIPVLNLPIDYPRPMVQSFAGDIVNLEISAAFTRSLKVMALNSNVTLYISLLAVFNILLSRLTRQEDIIIGTPVVNRRHTDLEQIIGMFVNTLALRNFPNEEKTFNQFLHEVKHRSLQAFENQEYPFEYLVEKVDINRDTSRNPLFDVMFALQDILEKKEKTSGMEKADEDSLAIDQNQYSYRNRTAQFDLILIGRETDDKLALGFQYCTKLFKKATIERFITYFKNIISVVIETPGIKLKEIDILTTKEKRQVLYDFNDTETQYPQNKTIHVLFQEQVQKTPDRIAAVGPLAIKYRTHTTYMTYISYGELNQKTDQLASLLKEKGIGPDAIVGIMIERSVEMIIGILGILKAGGAYLPIDPDYPEERIKYMLEDSSAEVFISTLDLSGRQEKLSIVNCQLLMVNEKPSNSQRLNTPPKEANSINNYQLTINHLQLKGNNLAYIIYTSGSTGRPKGVMVTHRSVVNVVTWYGRKYQLGPGVNMLLMSNYTFDPSVDQVFGTLLFGAVLHVIPKEQLMDMELLRQYINKKQVHIVNFVPLFLNELLSKTLKLKSLQVVISGAERLDDVIKDNILTRGYRLYNHYGPTEATVDTLSFCCTEQTPVQLGEPIANVKVYILDKSLNPVPIGVTGELSAAGVGVARGYLNNPELTAEKFCLRQPGGALFEKTAPPGPPRKNFSLPYYPIYMTGDLTRWRSNGNIEFLGRIDHQVKIRVFRIELGEIENHILNHENIKEAVVTAKKSETNDQYLCAYFVASNKDQGLEAELKEFLTKKLPDYMVPLYFTQLEKLPLTPNGKIDRKALPEPQRDEGKNYVAPDNKIQMKLVEIWSQILGIKKDIISIESNFFALGGHSLKATFLAANIHKELHVKVPLAMIFKTPTIKGLSQYIQNSAIEKHAVIQSVEKKEYYTLSSSQGRLFVLRQMDRQNIAYNMPGIISLAKVPDLEKLEKTFIQLIKRHESLRTSFHLMEETPIQRIHNEVELKIDCFEGHETHEKKLSEGTRGLAPLSKEPAAGTLHPVTAFVSSFIRPFDLSQAPLLRVGLLELTHTPAALRGHPSQEGIVRKYFLLLDMHHIISDGVSQKILGQDFMALLRGEILPLLRLQYKDFATWQTNESHRIVVKQQEAFWLNVFAGEIPLLNLPIDYPRPLVQSFAGDIVNFEISAAHTRALKNLALDSSSTLYILLLAAFNILLSRLTNQEDIIIGTPVVNRRHTDLEQIIGMFVNTLVLRNFPNREKSFNQFLREVKHRSLQAFENQEYPFENLVEKVADRRDAGRNPLFDVMFALQDFSGKREKIRGKEKTDQGSLTIDQNQYSYNNRTAQFDLALTGRETHDKLALGFQYCTTLFKEAAIKRFIAYFKKIISVIIETPGIKIVEIDILTPKEKHQVLYDFNESKTSYPEDKTIHVLFKEQVEKTPNQIAVMGVTNLKFEIRTLRSEGTRGLAPLPGLMSITYKELNEKANQLAHLLIEKGVGTDTIVGLIVERSIEMIIGLVGILKAGGAYLPIDPDYPEERINYMLNDSAAKISLTSDAINRVPTPHRLSLQSSNLPASSTSNLTSTCQVSPANLAYIIYTSGSTGRPKGVLVQHQNVIRLVKNANFIDFTPYDRLLLTGNIVFDITTFEIWWPLLNGLTLFLVNQQAILNARELENLMTKNRISILHLTPQLFNQLAVQRLEIFAGLKYFLVGGDLVSPQYVNLLRNTYENIKILHMYGPTENTTFSTFHPVTRDYETVIPIGKPLGNSFAYIVDKAGNLVPIGVSGELLIGGDGTARGYLNKPQLTAEKFCLRQPGGALFEKTAPPGPPRKNFSLNMSDMSYMSYIYMTGDLARWLFDGNIEFLGRIDSQVKIRGFRIEPGEIENHLLKHESIREAAVIQRKDRSGDNYLCAYAAVAPKADRTPQSEDLKGYLSTKLPDYMIPSYFVYLETLPKTPTGKIDRKALPEPEINTEEDYTPPRNEIEQKLVEIWTEVLGRTPGINDNFFALGGHSLKATIMAARIYKELSIQVPLAEIFKGPTIRQLSAYLNLNDAIKGRYTPIEAAEKRDYYPLSSAQERFYILQRVTPESSAYNMAVVHQLEGYAENERFEYSIKNLIKRHETLRTSFQLIHGQPVQRVHEEVEFRIEYHIAERTAQSEKSNEERCAPCAAPTADILKSFIRPFDLSRAPLLRLGLTKISPHHHILMFDMHHIISDGTSMNLFFKEFMDFYAGNQPQPLQLQYKDFSHWQYNHLKSGKLKKQEAYWIERFTGDLPVLNMPIDFPRPAIQSFDGDQFDFILEKSLTHDLNRLIKETGTTLFMVLTAVFNILLNRYTSQEDIITGTTTAGRFHPDLQHIIGLLIETLALRYYPLGEQTFNQFLMNVKTGTLAVYENQDYPFKELIKKLGAENEISRNPVFDAMLMVQNIETVNFELQGLTFSPYQPPGNEESVSPMSKVDFTLTAAETGDEISFNLEYCTRLYKRETMERFAKHFINIIKEVTAEPTIKLSAIQIIDTEEKKQLLEEFNHSAQKYTRIKPVHELFADQVRRTPDHMAVVGMTNPESEIRTSRSEGTRGLAPLSRLMSITYKELNERSHQLARLLRQTGVTPDTIVGIMVEPSLEMIIGLLGILKSGGAYLPIDPNSPEERIKYILKDSGAKIFLSDAGIEYLETEHPSTYRESPLERGGPKGRGVSNLAYIIYTSGSTGRPKGVMVEHRNLTTYINAFEKEFHLQPEDTVIRQASYTFDASVEELYPILLKGGKLAVTGKEVKNDINALCNFIVKHQVTMITCSPQLLNELNKFANLLTSLRVLISGGDRLNAEYIENLLGIGAVYNTYGPTEATVCATYFRCSGDSKLPTNVPIGKPITNYRVYILDKYANLLPVGVPGELCITGGGVTRGYLNRPELTAEKFCLRRPGGALFEKTAPPGPPCKNFLLEGTGSNIYFNMSYIYRTGDLARWLSDGNIEFLGRIDRQVKIRGYRIELGEIENQLTLLENIKQAVVVEEKRKSGQNSLAAYVVLNQDNKDSFKVSEVKARLSHQLPGYMIPPYIMAVKKIPMTLSGKIDRKQLPRPGTEQAQPYSAPGSDKEKILAEIWKEVLELNQVGRDDNFFDLGGTSLDIFSVNTRINEIFKKQIPIVSMFQYPTIRSLVSCLEEETHQPGIPGEKSKALAEAVDKGKTALKKMMAKADVRIGLEMAIIGIACIFPGAADFHEFWENLQKGIDSISFFTDEELLAEGEKAQTFENPNYIKARGMITGAEYFDSSFFGYTPVEAQIMDPQARIFLQCIWHALEDAGYDPFSYNQPIGLYAGASPNLQWEALASFSSLSRGFNGFMVAQLADKDFMCTHISYKLNLKGPSISIQTACSTSLVAIHNAVQGLLLGECHMALAGGVSITYPSKQGYLYQQGMIFSADGHNKTFDSSATGSVFGNGVGVVVLKKLEEAIRDRDHIYAVVKGSAINNDGIGKVGYTAPSVDGQAEVIKKAQLMAEVESESITYIEAHGTATPLGDTVEIQALKQAFNTGKKRYCAIGTVKSNVGHLYSAAGAAGFIKTVLALKHRLIPPSLHFKTPNPEIDFENSPFYVNTELKEWKNNGYPLRAGVSSFGIGGTNAHMILEEAPKGTGGLAPLPSKQTSRQYQLILLSAQTPTALEKQTENLIEYLKKNPGINLADTAYTLQPGRKHFSYRRMFVCSDFDRDGDKPSLSAKRLPTTLVKEDNPTIIFMFCGQGSQYVNMGIDLYRTEPIFKKEMDRCFEILNPLVDVDLKEILYPHPDCRGGSPCPPGPGNSPLERGAPQGRGVSPDIHQTEITQPLVFTFEYALAKLLMQWGIKPQAMIGYSLGEYIAACISGVLSLEDALNLVAFRGQLIRQTLPGAMTSVPLPEKELKPFLNKNLSLAIVNGPTCIVSGAKAAVEVFEKEMKQKKIICVPINISHAVHSQLMNPLRPGFENKLKQVSWNKPQIPFISNVTGDWITAEQAANPGYWGEHMCSTVRFSDGLNKLLEKENSIFIEIGAGRILGMMVRVHPAKKPGHRVLNIVKHQQEKVPDDYFLLDKVGQLWLYGQQIDWAGFYREEERYRVSLPGYPFEGKRYWMDMNASPFNKAEGVGAESAPGFNGLENPDLPGQNDEPPRNEIERFIARLWQEFLGIPPVGIYDNFFQLNGNSLIAAQLIAKLTEEYQVNIPINHFYEEPTIAHLSEVIKELQQGKASVCRETEIEFNEKLL
jgi:tyrocidine synthetase-3